MKHNDEIRAEAWDLLWARKWFWRLLGSTLLLQVCVQAVSAVYSGVVRRLGAWDLESVVNSACGRPGAAPLPGISFGFMAQVASSTLIFAIILCVMSGVVAFGNARVMLKARGDDCDGWMAAAFSGFRRFAELGWLMFLYLLVYAGWMLLAGLPLGLAAAVLSLLPGAAPVVWAAALSLCACVSVLLLAIPFYRYRFLFFLRADHPGWTAGRCLRECSRMMAGNKMRSFRLDCSYWRILLALLANIMLLGLVLGSIGVLSSISGAGAATKVAVAAFGVLALVFGYFVMLALSLVAGFYIGLGQTVLYREIHSESTIEREEIESELLP